MEKGRAVLVMVVQGCQNEGEVEKRRKIWSRSKFRIWGLAWRIPERVQILGEFELFGIMFSVGGQAGRKEFGFHEIKNFGTMWSKFGMVQSEPNQQTETKSVERGGGR